MLILFPCTFVEQEDKRRTLLLCGILNVRIVLYELRERAEALCESPFSFFPLHASLSLLSGSSLLASCVQKFVFVVASMMMIKQSISLLLPLPLSTSHKGRKDYKKGNGNTEAARSFCFYGCLYVSL